MEAKKAQSPEQLGLQIPSLFLVMKGQRKTVPGREWFHIRQQCAGIACLQHEFYGTPVTPRGKIALGLARISEHFYDTSMGTFGITMDDALEYRAMLNQLGLDCNHEFSKLAEGYYPIDLPSNLGEILEDEELPDDLDQLIDWEAEGGGVYQLMGIIGRWSLVWLSQNSD